MAKLIVITGRITALLGVFICAGAGISRIFGVYELIGLEVVIWFTGGIALNVSGLSGKAVSG
jgi:hypothetical protein